jgi:poly(hydroxyalkanoate) depolymerase family esterase
MKSVSLGQLALLVTEILHFDDCGTASCLPMTTPLRFVAPALAFLTGFWLVPAAALAQNCPANWKCSVDYGASTKMDLYVPTNVDASPGIVVSLHYCGGNASNAKPWFQSLADKHGFTIITPGAGGNCFDAKPERSGERDAIVKMVKYVIAQNHADASRVFAAGASSGACMTNALLAAYPDVFAGGSVLAGVPAGAWTGGNAYGWSTPAGNNAQAWGEIVRKADPGFTGKRPRVQLWHGTADTTLTYSQAFPAEVAQWTNVFGVTDANAEKTTFQGGQDSWARTTYKDSTGAVVLETDVAQNAPHDLSGRGLWTDVVRFFGLDMDSPTSGGGTGSGGAGGAGNTAGGSAGGAGPANGGAGGLSSSGGSGPSAAGSSTATAGTSGSTSTAGSSTGGPSPGGSAASVAGSSSAAGGSDAAEASNADNGATGCACDVAGGAAGGGRVGALLSVLVVGLSALRRRRLRG